MAVLCLGRIAARMTMPTKTPTVMPTSELILVKSAKTSATTPMENAGTKILAPRSL